MRPLIEGSAEKACSKCKAIKPHSEFYWSATVARLSSACRLCTQTATNAKRHAAPAETKHKLDTWRAANPDKIKLHELRARCRKYGLTLEDYYAMLEQQDAACGSCKDPFGDTTPNIDHCHTTQKVRGLLCLPCNIIAGHGKDTPARVHAVAFYLERHVSAQ